MREGSVDHLEGRGARSGRAPWTTWEGEGRGQGGLRGPPGRERGVVREGSMDHLEGLRGGGRGVGERGGGRGVGGEGMRDNLLVQVNM